MVRWLPSIPAEGELFQKTLRLLFLRGFKFLLIVVISYLVYLIGSLIIRKIVALQLRRKKEPTVEKIKAQKRALTIGTLLDNLLKYLIFFIAGFEILTKLFSIDAAPIVASAGIVGLAVGFGAQSLVKDIVSGFFILFENQYAVGDFVGIKATGMEAAGIVEEFGLRSTTIRDLSGNLHYIPNGNINGVDKYPKGYVLYLVELTLPSRADQAKVASTVKKWSQEVMASQSLVVAPPRLKEITTVPKGQISIQIELAVIPTTDWLVEKTAQVLAEKLKEALKLKQEITFFPCPLDSKVLEKHKKTIVIK